MAKTTFQLVSEMNIAFGNPKGDPLNIDWARTRRQFVNIGHEFVELLQGLGLDPACVENILGAIDRNTNPAQFNREVDLDKVRDASRDVVVFADGGHHLMGIDGDRDMHAVLNGVMSRFVKDEEDLTATINKHWDKGVTEFYLEGDFPTKIMKSGKDQPDAPKGKFLKSASYKEPVFYKVWDGERTSSDHVYLNKATGKYHFCDEAEQVDPTPYDSEFDAAEALGNYIQNHLTETPEQAEAKANGLESKIFSKDSQGKLAEAAFKANSLDQAISQAKGDD